jgi:hypothetical protein
MLSEQQDVDPGPLLQPDKIVQDARMIFLATIPGNSFMAEAP